MRTPQTPEVIRIDDEAGFTRPDAEETTFIPCNDNRDSDQDDEARDTIPSGEKNNTNADKRQRGIRSN